MFFHSTYHPVLWLGIGHDLSLPILRKFQKFRANEALGHFLGWIPIFSAVSITTNSLQLAHVSAFLNSSEIFESLHSILFVRKIVLANKVSYLTLTIPFHFERLNTHPRRSGLGCAWDERLLLQCGIHQMRAVHCGPVNVFDIFVYVFELLRMLASAFLI